MAYTTGFFNVASEEAPYYQAADYARYFSRLVSNGVFIDTDADALSVSTSGLTASIKTGSIYINGYGLEVTENHSLTLAPGAPGQDRVDLVVMRLDMTTDATNTQHVGSIYPAVVQGNPGSSAPLLTRNNDVYEMCLARVTVPAGSSTASAADTRGDPNVCGWASFRGQPAYSPPGQIPSSLWSYTAFPKEMTLAQRQAIEQNESLYEKFLRSRVYGDFNRLPWTPISPQYVHLYDSGFDVQLSGHYMLARARGSWGSSSVFIVDISNWTYTPLPEIGESATISNGILYYVAAGSVYKIVPGNSASSLVATLSLPTGMTAESVETIAGQPNYLYVVAFSTSKPYMCTILKVDISAGTYTTIKSGIPRSDDSYRFRSAISDGDNVPLYLRYGTNSYYNGAYTYSISQDLVLPVTPDYVNPSGVVQPYKFVSRGGEVVLETIGTDGYMYVNKLDGSPVRALRIGSQNTIIGAYTFQGFGISGFPNQQTERALQEYIFTGLPVADEIDSAEPPPANTVPSAPQNASAIAGNGQATLTWTVPIDNGGTAITSYEVSRDGSNWTAIGAYTQSYSFTGLTNGVAYTLRVRALNAEGSGAAATAAVTPQATTPGTPSSVSAVPGIGQVAVSWQAPNNGGSSIIRYELSTNGSTWANIGNTLNYMLTGLSNDTTYVIRIRAVNAVGAGTAAQISIPLHWSSTTLTGLEFQSSNVYAERGTLIYLDDELIKTPAGSDEGLMVYTSDTSVAYYDPDTNSIYASWNGTVQVYAHGVESGLTASMTLTVY